MITFINKIRYFGLLGNFDRFVLNGIVSVFYIIDIWYFLLKNILLKIILINNIKF